MKRLLLLALLLFCAKPASADVIVAYNDSMMATGGQGSGQQNLQHFFALMERSMKPGSRMRVTNVDGYTLANMRDDISPTATDPQYRASLLILIDSDRNQVLLNPSKAGRMAMTQLSKAANRPKVPILYINVSDEVAFQPGGNCSLGVKGTQIQAILSGGTGSAFAATKAGFQIPINSAGWVKDTGGAFPAMGDYVTPVMWLGMYGYSKSDPDGVGGDNSHPGTPSDTLIAWFYNPPDNTTLTDRTTKGFGCIQLGSSNVNAGGAQYPESGMGLIAVGMAAYLAPDQFKFPAVNVALDVDDGCKYINATSGGLGWNYQYNVDAYAGLDSLGVWKIPYTVGVEIDSMDTQESNGLTRFQNLYAAARKYGMGRFTVHCHKGMAAGGSVTDSSLASVSGRVYADILGNTAGRWSLAGPSAATKNQSVLFLLDGATQKLIDYAGDANLVSACVMAPTDNYKTNLAGTSGGNASTYDSIGVSIALAGAGYKGYPGYKVIRTQYLSTSANYQQGGGVGGMPRGFAYPLPSLKTIAQGIETRMYRASHPLSILYAPSSYIYGTTTDTVSTQTQPNMRVNMNTHIGGAMGFVRAFNKTDAQDGTTQAFQGSVKTSIFVTHLPNWRQGLGVTSNGPFSGGRPAWEAVRCANGAMELAKWCALQANTSTTTYFRDGPLKWVWGDQMSEADVR